MEAESILNQQRVDNYKSSDKIEKTINLPDKDENKILAYSFLERYNASQAKLQAANMKFRGYETDIKLCQYNYP